MKLHRRLFWLLILLLPTQIGRHFWPEWTQVLGLKIDYLSPTVYLTDLLVVTILLTWWWQTKKIFKLSISYILNKYWWILVIFIFLLVNSFMAISRGAAIYKLVKILEFTFLGIYIVKERYSLKDVSLPLSVVIIYSSLIAIVQFIKQASIDNILWWLGERSFNLITPGIAKAIINGRLVMRPYSIFPHPNVLAGFILVSMILVSTPQFKNKTLNLIKYLALIFGGITIVISFSRSGWLAGLLIGLLAIPTKMRNKRKLIFAICCSLAVAIIGMLLLFKLPFSTEEAITQRYALAKIAIKMIRINPLGGVGLNNFISQLPFYWQQFGMTYLLQPVHNIYLLTAAELGVTGLIIFLWFLVLTYKRLIVTSNCLLITALTTILFLGFFDHYWLTLQQPQLLFLLILGLSWSR